MTTQRKGGKTVRKGRTETISAYLKLADEETTKRLGKGDEKALLKCEKGQNSLNRREKTS